LLSVFVIVTAAIPVARSENRNDSRPDSHDSRHDSHEARHGLAQFQQEIDALKAQLTATKASSWSADAALQQQITDLANQLAGLRTSPSGGSSISVFDGSGNNVGEVIGVDSDNIPWVVVTAHDANAQSYTFALQVFRGQLTGGSVLFTTADCSGTAAYIEPLAVLRGVSFESSAISIAGVDHASGVVYAAAAGAAVTPANFSSRRMDDGSCFAAPFLSSFVVPATPVTFSTTFTPPYTAR
jgi:hypothetical protein